MKQVLAVRVGAKKAVGHIVSKKWWPTVMLLKLAPNAKTSFHKLETLNPKKNDS